MTKTKTKTKTKTGERNAIVTNARLALREACPYIMIQTRPLPADASGKLATRVTDFGAAKETWLDNYRKHIMAGGKASDAPAMPTSKWFDPNSGLLTANQHDALIDQALEEDASGVVVPPKYNPVQVAAAHALNCRVMRRGSVTKHKTEPKDWDKKLFGPWIDEWLGDDGETITEPSGMFVDTDLPRQAHASKAEDMLTDDASLLTFGNLRIVCGDGTHDKAACFTIRAFKGGSYGALDLTRKRLSLAGRQVKDVVFRIEDRPNNGGAYVLKGKWMNGARVIEEIPFMPGQVLTPGNLLDSKSKVLDAKAIRKLDGDTKGLKFKALDAPIIGKNISFEDIWAQVSQDKAAVKRLREREGRSAEYQAGSPRAKSVTNIRTTARTSPYARFAFGFRAVQAGMVPFTVASGNGKIEDGEFSMGVVIGARSADDYNTGVLEVNPKAAAPKAAKKAAAPKAAKKAAAPKAAKKAAATQAAKKAAAPKAAEKAAAPKAAEKAAAPKAAEKAAATKAAVSATPPDAAPPVEHDTAELKTAKTETVEA